jgi:hypothetical protein
LNKNIFDVRSSSSGFGGVKLFFENKIRFGIKYYIGTVYDYLLRERNTMIYWYFEEHVAA